MVPILAAAKSIGRQVRKELAEHRADTCSAVVVAAHQSVAASAGTGPPGGGGYQAAPQLSLFGDGAQLIAPARMDAILAAISTVTPRSKSAEGQRKPIEARKGTQDNGMLDVVRTYECISLAADASGPGSSYRNVLDAIRDNTQPPTSSVADACSLIAAMTTGKTDGYQRAMLQALRILLQCSDFPQAASKDVRALVHRSSYGKLADEPLVPRTLVEQLDGIDLRGIDGQRLQRDMASLAATLATPCCPPTTDLVAVARHRNQEIEGALQATCTVFMEGWLANRKTIELPGVGDDALAPGTPVRIQDPLRNRARKSNPVRHVSEHIACAMVLSLLLYGYNFESVLHGRFAIKQGELHFMGRKPRAMMAQTNMHIDVELLEECYRLCRAAMAKSPTSYIGGKRFRVGLHFEDEKGWHKLDAKRFGKWFNDFVEPQIANVAGYNYTNIRPLVAQMFADKLNGELAAVQRQLHHAECSETVDYVDGPDQRLRVDRVAALEMRRVEQTCLAGLPPSTIEALALDPTAVAEQSEDFRLRSPDAFSGASPAFFAVSQPPNFACGRLAKRQAFPPAPSSYTAALWRASASLLVAAEVELSRPPVAGGRSVAISIAMPDGSTRPFVWATDFFFDLVDTATNAALALSGVNSDEISSVLSSRLAYKDGVWRAKFLDKGQEISRPISATAAKAIKVHQHIKTLPAWGSWRRRLKRPTHLHAGASAFKAFCTTFGIAHVWADCKSFSARPLFSPARLRLSLANLWHLMGGAEQFPASAFAYQSADHRNNRVRSVHMARLQGLQADPVFSPALRHATAASTKLLDLLTARNLAPRTHMCPNNDNVALDLALPGWRLDCSQAFQLMLRIAIVEAASRSGLMLTASFRDVRMWEDASLGLVPLNTNSLTSNNVRHGSLVTQIRKGLKKPGLGKSVATLAELLNALPATESDALHERFLPLSQHSPGEAGDGDQFHRICANYEAFLSYGVDALRSRSLDHKTIQNCAVAAGKFAKFAARHGVDLLDVLLKATAVSTLMGRWVEAQLQQGLKFSTVNKDLKNLRCFSSAAMGPKVEVAPMNTAENSVVPEILPWLPAHTIEAITVATRLHRIAHKSIKARRVPSDDELSRLLAAASGMQCNARNRALLLLATASTLRVSELLSLEDGDLERSADGKYVFVNVWQKNGSLRMITLAADLVDLCFGEEFHAERRAIIARLRKAGDGGEINTAKLFLSRGGKVLDRYEAASMMTTLSHVAGVDAVTMHALRRKGLCDIKDQLDATHPDSGVLLGISAGHANKKTTEAFYVGRMIGPTEMVPVARMMVAKTVANDICNADRRIVA